MTDTIENTTATKTSVKREYAVPEGGFPIGTVPTDGFDVSTMSKLKPADFTDEVDYLRWSNWYYGELAKLSQLEAAKPAPERKRVKPSKPVYAVPAGGFTSSETPGFDVSSHAKLVRTDFASYRDFDRWESWFYSEKARKAQSRLDRLLALGSTAEERKLKQKDAKVQDKLADMVAAAAADPAAKERMAAFLAGLFESLNSQG